VLPVLAPLASLSLAGQEHGRTIPLGDFGRLNYSAAASRPICSSLLACRTTTTAP